MRIIELNQETKDSLLENLLKRSPSNYGQYEQTVNEIIADVRARKDQALFEYTSRFDKCELTKETIKVTEEEIEEAYAAISPEFIEVMKKSAHNIRSFHENSFIAAGSFPKTTEPFWDRRSFPLPFQESMFREERRHILPAF